MPFQNLPFLTLQPPLDGKRHEGTDPLHPRTPGPAGLRTAPARQPPGCGSPTQGRVRPGEELGARTSKLVAAPGRWGGVPGGLLHRRLQVDRASGDPRQPGRPTGSLRLTPSALFAKAATRPVTCLSGSSVVCVVTLRTSTSQD